MISLPYVKDRLTALLEVRTEFDSIRILGRPLADSDDITDRGDVEAFARFGDASADGIDAELEKVEACASFDRGWVETYLLPLELQIVAADGDVVHRDAETVRRRMMAACVAVCAEPTLGRLANPDVDGYVVDLWVRVTGSSAAVGNMRTEGGAFAAATVGAVEFTVTAWLDVNPS